MEHDISLHPILKRIQYGEKQTCSIHGWELAIICSSEEGLSVETCVFQGEHFVPLSVRAAVYSQGAGAVHSSLLVHVRLEEEESRVVLHYTGGIDDLSPLHFNDILNEFAWAAEQWWQHLDERSRGDLIHMPIRPR